MRKKKKQNHILKNKELKDEDQIVRMRNLSLKPWYSCSGELYKLLNTEVVQNLVKKIKKGEIKLNSDLVYEKNVITTEEKFLENLDRYVGYVRDNYYVDHIEQLALIELSLTSKYSDVLFSERDFHTNDNYKYYYDQFRKMFMDNLYQNAFYLKEFCDTNSAIEKFINKCKNYNYDDENDIIKIEKIFKKIINKRKNNLFNAFIPYSEYNENSFGFYGFQVEWVLSEYFE